MNSSSLNFGEQSIYSNLNLHGCMKQEFENSFREICTIVLCIFIGMSAFMDSAVYRCSVQCLRHTPWRISSHSSHYYSAKLILLITLDALYTIPPQIRAYLCMKLDVQTTRNFNVQYIRVYMYTGIYQFFITGTKLKIPKWYSKFQLIIITDSRFRLRIWDCMHQYISDTPKLWRICFYN